MTNKFLTIALGAALGLSATAASAATLDDVKANGFLQCGSNTGLAGFAAPNDAASGPASTLTHAAQSPRRSSTTRKP